MSDQLPLPGMPVENVSPSVAEVRRKADLLARDILAAIPDGTDSEVLVGALVPLVAAACIQFQDPAAEVQMFWGRVDELMLKYARAQKVNKGGGQ